MIELRLKQLDRLLGLISKTDLSLEQAGPVISSLDPQIWDVDSLGKLKPALADQTTEPTEGDSEKRVKQQDYTSLLKYLTEDWWLFWRKPQHRKTERRLWKSCVT